MSIREAARRLHVSESHLYRMIAREEIKVIRNPLYRKRGPVQVPVTEIQRLKEQFAKPQP